MVNQHALDRLAQVEAAQAELARQHAELTALATLPPAPPLNDFPTPLVSHILLTASAHKNLLHHAALCAKVCREWRRIMSASPAYMAQLLWQRQPRLIRELGRDGWQRAGERERALGEISYTLNSLEAGLRDVGHYGRRAEVRLDNPVYRDRELFSEPSRAAFGAAVSALPHLGERFTVLGCGLRDETVVTIVDGLRRGFADTSQLTAIGIYQEHHLGDAGLAALAGALSSVPTLTALSFNDTRAGSPGMVAVAQALPVLTRLEELTCCANHAVGQAGWEALGAALPKLPALSELNANCNTLMTAGIAALAEGVAGCTSLAHFNVSHCSFHDDGADAIVAVLPRCTALREMTLHIDGTPSAISPLNAMHPLYVDTPEALRNGYVQETRDALDAAAPAGLIIEHARPYSDSDDEDEDAEEDENVVVDDDY